jgi:hypothetical protein
MKRVSNRLIVSVAIASFLAVAPSAVASVVSVGLAAFPTGSPVLTFPASGAADGVTAGDVTFHYPAGGLDFGSDAGPTNDLTPPYLVSHGAANGVLTMNLSVPVTMFGFGWGVALVGPVPDALTVSVLNSGNPLGSLDYGGDNDPSFTGGFAGIQSSAAFNEVQVTFAQSNAPGFLLGNIIQAGVPEPGTLFLVPGCALLFVLRRRRDLSA